MANLLKYIKNPVTGQQLLDTVESSIIVHKHKLSDIQKKQWAEGKDKSGQIIGTYKKATEDYAQEPPRPRKPKVFGKPYNLDWSGDMIRKTTVTPNKTNKTVIITIDSRGKNLTKLFETIKVHGFLSDPNTIFGYQPENLNEVTKMINKDSLMRLKNRI